MSYWSIGRILAVLGFGLHLLLPTPGAALAADSAEKTAPAQKAAPAQNADVLARIKQLKGKDPAERGITRGSATPEGEVPPPDAVGRRPASEDLAAAVLDEAGETARLKDGNLAEKLEAARKLGKAGRGRGRDALRRELRAAKDSSVRARIAEAMAVAPEAEDEADLAGSLKTDPSQEVRRSAAYALGFSPGKGSAKALAEAFLDPKAAVELRLQELNSLSRRGPEALGAFHSGLQDKDPFIRYQSLVIFSAAYDRDTVRPRMERMALDEDEKIKNFAARTLKEWKAQEDAARAR